MALWIPPLSPLARAARGMPAPGIKPTIPVEIDWDHPISRKLAGCWIAQPGGFFDLVKKKDSGVAGSITTESGLLVWNPASDNSRITGLDDPDNNPNDEITILQHCATGTGQYDEYGPFGSGNVSLGVYYRTNANGLTFMAPNGRFKSVAYSKPTFVAAMSSYWNGSAAIAEAFLNGSEVVNSGWNSSGLSYWSNLFFQYDTHFGGGIACTAYWNRKLSAAEKQLITVDPYCFLKPANDAPLLIGTAASGGPGTDDLLADNIESATELSTPAIGQTHALTAANVESAVEISAPALGQTHALTAVSLESATELSSPNLSEGADHNLLAEDIESATEVSAPAIGQTHVLTADNLESAIVISSPALGQVHALTSVSVEVATALSSPTLVDSGSITNAQIWAKLIEIHKILGLDATAPMTVTPTSRTAGDISQTISGDGTTSTTVTRD